MQVHLERETRHRWIVMDRDWHRVSAPTSESDPAPPSSLSRMLAAAETLATGFDFVRVDFYEIARQPLFGEMTFYPGSGLDPFDLVTAYGTRSRRRPLAHLVKRTSAAVLVVDDGMADVLGHEPAVVRRVPEVGDVDA